MSISYETAPLQRVRQIQGFLPVFGTILIVLFSSPLLVVWHGCEIPNTAGSANLVREGMREGEVEVILGEPNERDVVKRLWIYDKMGRHVKAPTVVEFSSDGLVISVSR